MARIPTAARRKRARDDDDDDEKEERSPIRRVSLAARILEDAQPPKLGGPPRTEEEKREVFQALAYMKSGKLTNMECALALDVSERSVVNYLKDPLYLEVQNELQADAKQRGHTTIAMLIDDALSELYSLMNVASSEFVRYKAAEKLLDVAGYNMPRDEAQRDNREEVSAFLEKVKARSAGQVNIQVNVQQAPPGGSGETKVEVVEADPVPVQQAIPAELEPYYRQVLPGGKLPPLGEQPPEVPGA